MPARSPPSVEQMVFPACLLPPGLPRRFLAVVTAAALATACRTGLAEVNPLPHPPRPPYLREFPSVAGMAVWLVNGQFVRDSLDIEFTNFGQHGAFSFIPAGEFWLDQEHTPGESRFFLEHLTVEHRLMAEGVDYDSALDRADDVEKALRAASPLGQEAARLLRTGSTAELIRRIHRKRLARYRNGVQVWLVDGELVRDAFFVDFTEGGHDRVYGFIPPGEVWLDDDVVPRERDFILLHELHERYLMSLGWDYDRAHDQSSQVELAARRHPGELNGRLHAELERNPPPQPR